MKFSFSHTYRWILVLLLVVSSQGLISRKMQTIPKTSRNFQRSLQSKKLTQLNLFIGPQLLFVGACAGAVFVYVATNIDSIKAQQKSSIDRAMAEQSQTLKTTQDAQREAIERAKAQQALAGERAKQIAEDAKRRADEATRR